MANYLDGDFKKSKVTVVSALGIGGDLILQIQTGVFSFKNISLTKELIGTKLITEETAKTFLRTAGWGILGGALLGPAGLLAGVLTKGNKKVNIVACEIKTGEKFVMGFSDSEYEKIKERVPHILPDELSEQSIIHSNTTEIIEDDPLTKIQKLGELKQAGILTEEEFETKKAELLSKI